MMKLARSEEPPWLYKRKGKASKGDKPRYAAHDDECLQHDNGSEAYCR